MSLILIAEDEPSIAMVLSEILTIEGHDVSVAATGVAALVRMRQDPRPDLAVVDLFMPEMGGRALVLAMQQDEALKRIPVIISTGAVLGSDTLPPAGTYRALLSKPFDLGQFCQLVSEIVSG